jgi:hypothetical protein
MPPCELPVVFLAIVFLAGDFQAGVFLAGVFLAVDFLAEDFLAVDFLAVDFLAGPLPAVAFLDGVFSAIEVGGQTPRSSVGARLDLITASLKPLRGVIFAFFDPLMRRGWCVCGLRPIRAGRSTLTNFAKPEIETGSPLATTAVTTSVRPLSTASTSSGCSPDCSATALTSSRRFTFSPP